MPVTKSPLRYPGGKTQIADFVKNIIDINSLDDIIYCEPFSGGFGVGLELLYQGKVKSLIINDLDIGIFSVWKAILEDSEKLIEMIQKVNININEWHKQKNNYLEKKDDNKYSLELAFATLYLNRTNRSGIINGGPIGGYKQNSKYKLDCRFNKEALISKVKKINSYRNVIQIYNLEANTLIKEVILKISHKEIFIFFDPPYYKQGKNLYTNFFDYKDHVILKDNIKSLDDYYWIVTYDFEEKIKELYRDFNFEKYQIRYSVNKIKNGIEYLFYNGNLKISEHGKVKFLSKN